ncbi:MAG: protocatechuate 3,4-dioxygenase subunit alpha [Paracoccaceae bacterium]
MTGRLKESPSQTAGPYVHIGCVPVSAGLERRGFEPQLGGRMVQEVGHATAITLDVTVSDGEGALVTDALIEIWQAGPEGRFHATPGFSNWGRQAVDSATGVARFETLKPGASAGQAPHILIWIAARGINFALTTRLYFPDEDNSADAVLALAGGRAGTLIADQTDHGYAHAISLQGPNETVFFDV